METAGIIVHKVWRSEVGRIILFFVLCIASVILSVQFPGSVIWGELISLGDYRIDLALPLFWLMPAVILGDVIWRIYNVRYFIDSRGIEGRDGIISFQQRITRLRYEDIRLIETAQSVLERILDVGDVQVGTAATGQVELILRGVARPTAIREMIQVERDRRQKLAQRPTGIIAPLEAQTR